jgi:hypothetical protein
MDSLLQLALMTKASRVFAKEGQFLCFPALSPYSFRPEQLGFAIKPTTADDWRAYSEFSRAVNHVARGPIHDPADETFLWDVVDDVLRRGECAGRQRTFSPEEEADYQAAMTLLYADPTGAAPTPSAAAVLYGHYRDAILVAEEDYRNRELTAELSEDEGVRARWREVEAPSIRHQIEQLYADWEAKGRKSAIESARQRLRVHAAAEAAATWDTWRAGLNPDLDMPTDVLLNRFAATSFTPADLAGAVDWPRLTLERAEILALAAEADPELKRRLGGEGQTTDVERVVFECRSAGLDRSWLPKDLFSARFWRLPPGEQPLSDGANPPKGRLPAYAAGVVFARNIQVVRRAAGGATQVRLQQFQAVNIFNLAEAQPVASRAIQPAQLEAQAVYMAPAALRPAPAVRAAAVRDHRATPVVRDHRTRVVRDHRRPRVVDAGGVWTAEPSPPPLPPPEPPPAAVDPNITILAMICSPLGRSPHPDPSLPWPAQG